MNLMAKLKAMQREIEALRARVEALEPRPLGKPVSYEDAMAQIDAGKASLTDFVWTLQDDPAGLPAKWADTLTEPIVDAKPIASATMAPPPKKRGRPPKAT